jgi:hypothetical protein
MAGISDSHNYRRHMVVARQLECEFGHEPVENAEQRKRHRRSPTHPEMMQAARSGIAPEATRAALTALWNTSSTGQAFGAALETSGYILARGDQRGFVAVDLAGEVHAINKKLTGLSASQVRDRLADVGLEQLPSVGRAKAQQLFRPSPPVSSATGSSEQEQPLIEPLYYLRQFCRTVPFPSPWLRVTGATCN